MDTKPIIVSSRSRFASIGEITETYLLDTPMPAALSMADGSQPSPLIATDVRIDYTDDALIVLFRGKFQRLRIAEDLPVEAGTGKTHSLWMHSDVYEFFVGPNSRSTGMYKEFQVSPDARFIDINVNRPEEKSDQHWASGLRCRSFVNEEKKIWSAAIEMPWNCFDTDYRSDCEWNANIYRATGAYHGDELLAWSATGYGEGAFHRYPNFGRIIFEK
ncbi:MAG TPA: hypothetical protein VK470_11285 [Bacteroidota bacterium]|nr:hypothetical protein [Bacteroidota bacterium]